MNPAELSAHLKQLYERTKILDDRRGSDGRTSIDPQLAIALIEIRNAVPEITKLLDNLRVVPRLDYDQSGRQ